MVITWRKPVLSVAQPKEPGTKLPDKTAGAPSPMSVDATLITAVDKSDPVGTQKMQKTTGDKPKLVPNPYFNVTPGSLLKVKDAAQLLGVCTKTIERWIRTGTLPASKVGGQWRIQRTAVLQLLFVNANWVPANDP